MSPKITLLNKRRLRFKSKRRTVKKRKRRIA